MKKLLIFSVILGMMLMSAGFVFATGTEKATNENNSRYLVKSNNGILKMFYGVRHKFDSGFTTDLSQGQLRFLKKFGVKVKKVELYHITAPPGACSPWPECKVSEEPIIEDRVCEPTLQIPYGIGMVNGGSGGADIKVAVLDTGVNQKHPDLVGNIDTCVAFGYRTCNDRNGHGTHVAGTILANGGSYGFGIFGVAPSAKLMAIKVLSDRGSGYADDIAKGIEYATNNKAHIISMSLGGSKSDFISDAIDYATDNGVLVIAAAGNSGPDDGSIIYPAANPKVIAVGAIDSYKNVPDFSSRGFNNGDYTVEEKEVEFGAPGVDVESTWKDGCYNTISGTSMATPHVAGLAAKLWQDNALDTRIYLQSIVKDIWTHGDDTATGFGLPIAPTD